MYETRVGYPDRSTLWKFASSAAMDFSGSESTPITAPRAVSSMARALLTAVQILSIWSWLPPLTVTERLSGLNRTPLEVTAPTGTPPPPSSLEVDARESLNRRRPLTIVLADCPGAGAAS